jgi:hypothetical protein
MFAILMVVFEGSMKPRNDGNFTPMTDDRHLFRHLSGKIFSLFAKAAAGRDHG